jgi:hypothetical protein
MMCNEWCDECEFDRPGDPGWYRNWVGALAIYRCVRAKSHPQNNMPCCVHLREARRLGDWVFAIGRDEQGQEPVLVR